MGEEGPEAERRSASTVARLNKGMAALTGIREWLWRSVLLAGCVLPHELGRLWRALRYRRDLRRLKTLVKAMPSLLVQYSFDGCQLQELYHRGGGQDNVEFLTPQKDKDRKEGWTEYLLGPFIFNS